MIYLGDSAYQGCSSENFAPEHCLSTERRYSNLKTSHHYRSVMVGAVILEQQKKQVEKVQLCDDTQYRNTHLITSKNLDNTKGAICPILELDPRVLFNLTLDDFLFILIFYA